MATTSVEAGQARTAQRFRMPRFSLGQIIAFLILALISVTWIVPFLWMLSTSLKAPQDLVRTNSLAGEPNFGGVSNSVLRF